MRGVAKVLAFEVSEAVTSLLLLAERTGLSLAKTVSGGSPLLEPPVN